MARREGRFALANGGTIFLDEVSELPLELQPKPLRLVQEGEFEPLGGTWTIKVDVRVLAATDPDLKQMSAEGKFRGRSGRTDRPVEGKGAKKPGLNVAERPPAERWTCSASCHHKLALD